MPANSRVDVVIRNHQVAPPAGSGSPIEVYPERANLFLLRMTPPPAHLYVMREEANGRTRERVRFDAADGADALEPQVWSIRRALADAVLTALQRAGYKAKGQFPVVINTESNYAPAGTRLQIYPAFTLNIFMFGGQYYLCFDHQLVVRSQVALAAILQRDPGFRLEEAQRALIRRDGYWAEARLGDIGTQDSRVVLLDGTEWRVTNGSVYPDLTRAQIARLAPLLGIKANDLERTIKQLSFLTVANAPRARLDVCREFAARLTAAVFPIAAGATTIELDPTPATLRPPAFILGRDLVEPAVAFDHVDKTKRAKKILEGLTSFGAYDKPDEPLRLVTLAPHDRAVALGQLVGRLNQGSKSYPGAERTFGTAIEVEQALAVASLDEYDQRLREFVRSPRRDEVDIALVYLPKSGDIASHDHPYFRIKALLAREGLASQMVDEATVLNPDWRDLNLALNVFSKSGHVPWVLDEAVDGADLFIGLSSSQVKRGSRIVRMMGYVNVFDRYGRWQFYQGDAAAFAFDDRLRHYEALVRDSIAAYRAQHGGPLGTVHIHLTKQFSAVERAVLARAVREAAPGAAVVFVWVNPLHHLRLYDLTEGGDGQIGRATYLEDAPGRLYLATTGQNAYGQKGMGTPVPLQLTVWTDPDDLPLALPAVGQQVLSLTRLNWGSSRNFCQEPITTKFAGDIARLMTHFLIDPTFVVNPRLRGTPWFL